LRKTYDTFFSILRILSVGNAEGGRRPFQAHLEVAANFFMSYAGDVRDSAERKLYLFSPLERPSVLTLG
jgi:hypothetical protein